MSKASNAKHLLKVQTTLLDNLTEEQIEELCGTDILQRTVISDPVRAGMEYFRFLQNGARVQVIGNHIIDCDAAPFVPKGWSITGEGAEHIKGGRFLWDPAKITLFWSDAQKQGDIGGHELRKLLKEKPALNANVLDYLSAHPHLIPEEWKGKAVFFWGTIYRARDGSLYVRYLHWDGKRWRWDFNWLDDDWYVINPAAVSAKCFVL